MPDEDIGMTFDLFLTSFVVVALAAMVQASTGFGFGIIAAPFLVLTAGWLVPGPLIFSALFLTIVMALREKEAIDFSSLKWIFVGRIPGTLIGLLTLTLVPREKLTIVVAVMILLAVGLSLLNRNFRPQARSLIGAGVASGFMGTTSSIGGPPIALIYQHRAGATMRATLAVYFGIASSISLIGLHFIGLFGSREFTGAVALLPAVLAGFLLSRWTLPFLRKEATRAIILGIAGMAGLIILVKSW